MESPLRLNGTRILLVTSYFPPELGPAPARMGALSRELARLGSSVEVLTCNPRYPRGYDFSSASNGGSESAVDGVRMHVFPLPVSNGRVLPRMIEEARFYLRGLAHGRKLEAPDAVIGSSPFFTAACLGLRLAREWGCPFIYDMRDLYPESLRLGRIPVPGLLYRYLQGWAKRLHRESSFVVVNQPSLHQALRERLPSENLRMVMNPVELPEGDAPQKTSSSDRLTVGYAGLWGRGYDFPTLLAVIEQADTSKFAFRLIGDGFWTRRVREFAEHSRHSLFIHFGWLPPEKLAAEYASWDIALLPVEPRWCVSMWPAKIPELTAHDIITIMPPQLPLTPFLARSPLILRARQATAEGYLRALNEAGARIRTLAMREREEAREMIRREFAPTQLAGSYAEIIRQAVATKGKDSPQATTPD